MILLYLLSYLYYNTYHLYFYNYYFYIIVFFTGTDDIELNRIDLHGLDYHIIGADLRKLDELKAKLAECSFDPKLPTLVMAECVLVYMDPDKSEALLQWLTSTFDNLFFINYEQVCLLHIIDRL